MVEGPKVVLKSERFRAAIVAKRLLAYDLASSSSSSSSLALSSIVHQKCEEVVAVGKELFLVFGREIIRIHFQMNGSELILKSGTPPPSVGPSMKKLTALKFKSVNLETANALLRIAFHACPKLTHVEIEEISDMYPTVYSK